MSDKHLEFVIVGIVSVEPERMTVIGRNGDVPVRWNDTFDALFRYKPRKYPDQLGDEPVREIEKPVSLRVVCIQAYDRKLEALGEGMTGSLALVGDGLRSLAPGWVLGKRNGSLLLTGSISGSAEGSGPSPSG